MSAMTSLHTAAAADTMGYRHTDPLVSFYVSLSSFRFSQNRALCFVLVVLVVALPRARAGVPLCMHDHIAPNNHNAPNVWGSNHHIHAQAVSNATTLTANVYHTPGGTIRDSVLKTMYFVHRTRVSRLVWYVCRRMHARIL